jgi:GGDEF domain-containing protein
VFFAYLPLALAVLAAVMRAIGWIPISWIVQYGVVIAMLIEVPMLMVALNIRSRERHAAQTREEALPTQDALTGLLTEHLFQDRLQQAVARSRRYGEDAAVVVVSLVNHRQITAIHGSTMTEQSLLRSVIMLRRLLRDVDTAARIGPSQFGLILEGVKSRDQVTQLGARLISLGLMPLKGFTPEVTLQFQFAGVLLREFTEDVTVLQPRLLDLLTGISPRSRRPIRFLQPTPTDAAPLAPNTPAPQAGQTPVVLQADPPQRYVEPDSDIMSSGGDDSDRSSGQHSR